MDRMILSCIFMIAVATVAAEGLAPQESLAVQRTLALGEFRMQACKETAPTVKVFLEGRAALRWRRLSDEYSEEQLNDFFLGAVTMLAEDNVHGALYNPWWDAILLVVMEGEPGAVPKIVRFAFSSGERFRGEPRPEVPATESVIPQKQPMAVTLWELMARTRKTFMGLTAAQGDALIDELQVQDDDDLRTVQIRSAARLKTMVMFLGDKPMQRQARRLARHLGSRNPEDITGYFTDDAGGFLPSYAKLPAVLRSNMIPYCYVPGKEGTLFVFFNEKLPRIFVTVTLPRNGFRHIMEWYDFQAVDQVLDIWKQRKEVR